MIQQLHFSVFEENENTNQKTHMQPMFIVLLFTIAKIWKQLKHSSMDERI